MTVGEVIAHLQRFPSGHRVVVEGYESGLSDVFPETIVETMLVVDHRNEFHWEGLYDEVNLFAVDEVGTAAVVLRRCGAEDNAQRLKDRTTPIGDD